MLQELGPDARELLGVVVFFLGVVVFFPQGVDENNLEWLFPTLPNGTTTFDRFCILSLTHRNNEFITMLAPLRDYLRSKDPALSSLRLRCATKECYFTRMSARADPNKRGFEDARWIRSEGVNVEHLLDVSTSVDAQTTTRRVEAEDRSLSGRSSLQAQLLARALAVISLAQGPRSEQRASDSSPGVLERTGRWFPDS